MYKQILINVDDKERRIAVLEDGKLVELWVERDDMSRIAGNIYKGIVQDVVPGIQAAFIDIGLEKAGFLHISEIEIDEKYMMENLDIEPEEVEGLRKQLKIQELLSPGDRIMVQVKKESIGSKGPKLTTHITLPGRHMVFIPDANYIAVSRKIREREERYRLKDTMRSIKAKDAALIIRTVAENKDKSSLCQEYKDLEKKWVKIQGIAEKLEAPALIWQELGLTVGVIRDLFNEDVDCLLIDDYEKYENVVDYLKGISPDLIERIVFYDQQKPLFDACDLEKDIEKMFNRKVWLKNGGYIIIEQTEALTSVDVNTGKYTGKKNMEDTLFQTNLLAAKEIARQIRLRDLGGIIVIDFIDMMAEDHREEIVRVLRDSFRNDKSPVNIYPVSRLGLVEMSRKRIRPNIMMAYSQVCPYCNGKGRIESLETITLKIERFLKRAYKKMKKSEIILDIHPEIYHYLGDDFERIKNWQKELQVKITLKENFTLHIESFKVFLVSQNNNRTDITEEFKI